MQRNINGIKKSLVDYAQNPPMEYFHSISNCDPMVYTS